MHESVDIKKIKAKANEIDFETIKETEDGDESTDGSGVVVTEEFGE